MMDVDPNDMLLGKTNLSPIAWPLLSPGEETER
jgi:hypothetical protein